MAKKPYYLAYEDRYKTVYKAGVRRWGHSPEDKELYETVKRWVEENTLIGKRIIEFACGEGAVGVILSELGCIYHGVDISPSAAEKAKEAVKAYPNAKISVLDMVRETTGERYDAALDCMGFHMLITDSDRSAYLKNAQQSLTDGAPMLFFRQSYRENAYSGAVHSFDEWKRISGEDYQTKSLRISAEGIECYIPLIAARAKNEEDYKKELQTAGFAVERFIKMGENTQCFFSASIFARKR